MTAAACQDSLSDVGAISPPSAPALIAAFNAALAAAGAEASVASLTIDRVRHTPERKLVAGVTASCVRGRERFAQIFGVRFFPEGASAERMEKARQGRIAPSRLGPGLLHLADVGAVAWAFPNDRKIESAHVFASVEGFSNAVFRRLSGSAEFSRASVRGVTILRYVPEHGCTARIDLDGEPFALIAKLASDDRGEIGLAAMRAIRHSDVELCPAPIASIPRFNLAIQSMAQGAPLSPETYLDPRTGAVEQAMTLLARLHQTPPPARLPRLDTRADFQKTMDRLSAFSDRAAISARGLLRAHDPPSPPARETLLHGDLHFGNILVEKDRGVLIDFDAAKAGAPEHDLGGFLAALIWRGAICGTSETALLTMLVGAVNAYLHVARAPLDLGFLTWRIGEALISERLARSLTRMKPGRIGAYAPLLDWSARAFRGDLAGALS
ncbi:MAG TPA: hypothetical protein DEA40_15635 [Parvularcula sp.]|nr:hypothetical protein [Parvularcula sp.]HBS34121.1 hypothetical protein [Parvularcula sp.]